MLDQGYLFAFTKLIDQILQLATSVYLRTMDQKKGDKDPDFLMHKHQLNEIWLYKLLHVGSALADLKKITRTIKEVNEAETVCN